MSLVRPRTQKEHVGSKESTDGKASVQDAVETDDLEETGPTVTATSTKKHRRRRTATPKGSSVAPESHLDLDSELASPGKEQRKNGATEQRRAFLEQAVSDKEVTASLNIVPEGTVDPGQKTCESHDLQRLRLTDPIVLAGDRPRISSQRIPVGDKGWDFIPVVIYNR